jgi:hypothetical protein
VNDPVEERAYQSQRRYIFAATLAVIAALIVAGILLA